MAMAMAMAMRFKHFRFYRRLWDNYSCVHKEREFFSSYAPCLHASLPANLEQSWNYEQADVSPSHAAKHVGKNARKKPLHGEYFSDSSKWRDKRSTKKTSMYPHSKPKIPLEAPWRWVKDNTAGLHQMESSGTSTSRFRTSLDNYIKIQELTEEGKLEEALQLLELMAHQFYAPPKTAFICLLRGCIKSKALTEGKHVHALVVQTKCPPDVFLSNHLIDMYSICGSVAEAFKVFAAMPHRNLYSWTTMISAYADIGQCKEAITLFQQMQQSGIEPDKVTCLVILRACTSVAALKLGQQLHWYIIKKGFDTDVAICTSLINMYAKCGCVKDAREVFNNMPKRDLLSWNAMVAGYAQEGLANDALDLYEHMRHQGMVPDNTTLLLLLKACASISALEQGKQLHFLILKRGLEFERNIQTTLIGMYANCGCLSDARNLFNNMDQRDIISWNTMIAAYAQQGLVKDALDLYEQMKHEGLQANEVTCSYVLSACCNSGLVDEGRHVFESMFKDHGVTPTLGHYRHMVDLLGRAGCLSDAEDLILKMPIQPT